MPKGILITFEGMEGSGKSTHCERLCAYLAKKGFEVVHVHEPGGTRMGEQLRDILLSDGNDDMVDRAELFLFMASRSQIVEKVIRPALNSGKVVVCDRYIDSTVAYQGYGRRLDEKFIRSLNKFAVGDVEPDLTIVLDVESPIALKRAKKRQGGKKLDRIEKSRLSFHQRVREGYLAVARIDSERVRIVDVDRDIKKTERAVKKCVDNFLQKRKKLKEE